LKINIVYEKAAVRSFEEELEMYEIPDILWMLMARKRQMSVSTRAHESFILCNYAQNQGQIDRD
jgi:hypothetical protein